MLALIRTIDTKKYFVSASDPHEVTEDFDKALHFFSKNHIFVWRKSNPEIDNTIAVDVTNINGKIEIKNIEDDIIGW